MSDRAAFLEQIRAEPEDDTLRLVFADWLQEQPGPADQARAEFIRLSINASHRHTYWVRDAVRTAYRGWITAEADLRCYDLLAAHAMSWRFGGLPVTSELDVGYRRGFIAVLGMHTEHWRDYGDDLAADYPLEEVEFTDWELPGLGMSDEFIFHHATRFYTLRRTFTWGGKRATIQKVMSEKEVLVSRLGESSAIRDRLLDMMEAESTAQKLLHYWWPKIRFTFQVVDPEWAAGLDIPF